MPENFFEYLNLKGINYNVDQLLFGLNKHRVGPDYDLGEFKPKLYNSMDIDDEPSLDKSLDKGKGASQDSDRMSISDGSDNDKPLNKGKGPSQNNNSSDEESDVDKGKKIFKGKGADTGETMDWEVHPDHPPVRNEGTTPEKSIFDPTKLRAPGTYPLYVPDVKTNPGPGFNVPGGKISIREPICELINWNTNILTQFRTMDLETAIEQRDNNLKLIEVHRRKLEFGEMKLAAEGGRGPVPTNEREAFIRQKVADDKKFLTRNVDEANARQTLLLSRIEFILIEESKKNK